MKDTTMIKLVSYLLIKQWGCQTCPVSVKAIYIIGLVDVPQKKKKKKVSEYNRQVSKQINDFNRFYVWIYQLCLDLSPKHTFVYFSFCLGILYPIVYLALSHPQMSLMERGAVRPITALAWTSNSSTCPKDFNLVGREKQNRHLSVQNSRLFPSE